MLVSILSALHEGVFTIDQVQGDLQTFDKRYILTRNRDHGDPPSDGNTDGQSEGNEYEVEVPYTWYICTAYWEELSTLPCLSTLMGEEQLLCATYSASPWATVLTCLPSSGYVNKYIENPAHRPGDSCRIPDG